MGIVIGVIASFIAYFCIQFRLRKRVDESLDVWAVHGMGGSWGTLATGLFAALAVNGMGAQGLIHGGWLFFLKQLMAVAVIWAFSFGMTWLLGKLVDVTLKLRVNETEESVGLDISQHGERAYGEE
jgi:Amt family ammonium transporter